MRDLSLTDYQAAGLLGNLAYESGGFEHLQEIKPLIPCSKGGIGVAQWTASRRRNFEAWCLRHNTDPFNLEANYGFLLHELRGEDKSFDYTETVRAVRRCPNLEAAVFSVGQTYERPAGTTRTHLPGYESRLDWGRRALNGARQQGAVDVPHPVLRRGSEGPAVGELQRRLKALGYAVGRIDDDFGPRTEAAVLAFQATRKIVIDGVVGNSLTGSTWNEIARAESEKGLTHA